LFGFHVSGCCDLEFVAFAPAKVDNQVAYESMPLSFRRGDFPPVHKLIGSTAFSVAMESLLAPFNGGGAVT
jgi:hypothetical protein